MRQSVKGWMVFAVLIGTMTYALAEDVTLTTYYPSPRGVYKELRTSDNTYLATSTGSVGIGQTGASAKLDVNGTALLRGNTTVSGTLVLQNVPVSSGGADVLVVDGSGNVQKDFARYGP